MTHETKVELCNTFIVNPSELVPSPFISLAVEKLSGVLHDKAIWKAVSF